MKRKKTQQKILKATFGILSTINDCLLISLELWTSFLTDSPGDFSMAKMQQRMNKALGLDKKQIQKSLYRIKKHGWIKEDLSLTKEGRKRLKSLLPTRLPAKKWDGNWYLVIFDIPECLRRKRNILREKLKDLGFGQLQQSVWISPINYLPIIEKIIEQYNLSSYVILSQTNKIGRERAQQLADKVWNLKSLNEEYQQFISDWEETQHKKEKASFQMKYLQILNKDPQLPRELLPDDWVGDKAYYLIQNFKISELIEKK